MARDIRALIAQMTLEEKAGLCSGRDFWNTKGVERLGIPSVMMTDGPHGLRKQQGEADHVGLHDSVPATCFPSGVTLASSWNRALIYKVGVALGEECQTEDVAILLGPALNIKRSPLCGRNFEYLSEDPFLSAEMAAQHIKGVQSQGVGTSPKHFAVNNQEHRRFTVSAEVDERTLREMYLSGFEGAVTQAKPWTVMCSYNMMNGEHCSQHHYLLSEILRDEWGYEGFVMSDWGAVDERVKSLAAGLELEMPASGGARDRQIVEAVQQGQLAEEVLDTAVERLLTIIFRAVDLQKSGASYDKDAHHALAREAAREGMVLLKNDDRILPLKPEGKIAVIGAFAKNPRYQGGGSSHILPTILSCAYDEMAGLAGNKAEVLYADGYNLEQEDVDQALLHEAVQLAASSDVAVIFAGLTDVFESEGYDRTHLRIPENHRSLIEKVAEVQSNVVVVLSNGSPIEMPWAGEVKGILEGYLGGQAGGGAVADLLFGEANPCGKLAETFPKTLAHTPSHLNFPGEGDRVEYKEGIFVGYRYYEAKEIEPLFPFGHGLSYTTFEYSGIAVDKAGIDDTEAVTVSVRVKNAGDVAGKEVVQLYVRDLESSVTRPLKELKGFEKILLQPEEETTVTFTLGKRAFAYYNTDINNWYVESGDFEILVGGSSQAIALKAQVHVESTASIPIVFHRNSTLGDLRRTPIGESVAQQILKDMSAEGGLLDDLNDENGGDPMMMEMMNNMPLRALITFTNGEFTEEMIEEILRKVNAG